MKLFKLPLALAAVMSLLLLGAPASADSGHTSITFECTNSPTTADTPTDVNCTFEFTDFGATSNDKVDFFTIEMEDAQVNEDEDAANGGDNENDPDDNQKIGETVVTGDFGYDGCGDANDGGTYSTYWEDTWTSYSESGWTKVAEYRTEFRVFFFFTEQVPTHVMKNNSTGAYKMVTDVPEDRGCNDADTTFDMTIYSHENNNNGSEWVGKNPAASGTYTATITATEVGGTTHSDTDSVTVS